MAALSPLTLRFSGRARLQLIGIQEFISERNPDAAARVGERIREAVEVLRFFPYAGRIGRSGGTREWVVSGLPYIIVYEIHPSRDEVVVLGVFHGAQKR